MADELARCVAGYARRVLGAVLEQHSSASVSSALGVWLLLACCAPAAQGADREALEAALGCPAEQAARLLADFMAAPPAAVRTALAAWVSESEVTPALQEWMSALPEQLESGPMPSQDQADAWADRETLGLIKHFPGAIDASTRIMLASALATKVSWDVPFDVVPAAGHLSPASPWRSSVSRLLWDDGVVFGAAIVRTEAAGLVAVHRADAKEDQDVAVISVSAAADVDRASVVAAAYEVAAASAAPGGWDALACSLFDLPLGPGHSWEISEREVRTFVKEPRRERIAGAALPAWNIESRLGLLEDPAFAVGPACDTLRELIGPGPDDSCDAAQVAVAAYNRYGFEAAAITALGIASAAMVRPAERTLERTAVLRFDHPHAAVAIAPSFSGLPLFTAWVNEPVEPQDHPPAAGDP